MSVTVSAVPFYLIFSLASSVSVALSGLTVGNKDLHLESEEIERALFNKKFDTTIMDRTALMKTLREHGAVNIKHGINGSLECDCECFHLSFSRDNDKLPYNMVITSNDNTNIDDLAKDIGNEYTLNAQEMSYNKIKERLKDQNLEIADEEVFDDNTIVLTVNLED